MRRNRVFLAALAAAALLLPAVAARVHAQVQGEGQIQAGDEAEPTVEMRVVNGTPTPPGTWASLVLVLSEIRQGNSVKVGRCGGTVIGDRWVLTAGHCVASAEGLRQPEQMRVIVGTNWVGEGRGRRIAVDRVILHPGYPMGASPPVNDVALLRLASSAGQIRQVLATAAGRAQLEGRGAMAKVAGFGLTAPGAGGGEVSNRLLEADLPLVAQRDCVGRWGAGSGRVINEGTVCAGWMRENEADSCGGDSGGPLVRRSAGGTLVQIGVVSWGSPACGRTPLPGIYASVGNHESFIRQHVPDAEFFAGPAAAAPPVSVPPVSVPPVSVPPVSVPPVSVPPVSAPPVSAPPPRPAAPPPVQGSGASPGQAPVAPPAQGSGAPPVQASGAAPAGEGQIAIDILDGASLRVGQRATLRFGSSVAGQLVVVTIDPAGQATQILPNRYTGRNGPGQVRSVLRAGELTIMPGPADGFALTVSGPTGEGKLLAAILPPGAELTDLLSRNLDLRPIADLDAYLVALSRLVEAAGPSRMAVSTRSFTVLPPR